MNPDVIRTLAPVLAFGMSMTVVVVGMFMRHQQKMAKLHLVDRAALVADSHLVAENDSLRRELADMKTMLHEQAIAIDNLAVKSTATSNISQRLENHA